MTKTETDQAEQLTLDRRYFCTDCKRTGVYFSVTVTTCPQCGSTNVTVSS